MTSNRTPVEAPVLGLHPHNAGFAWEERRGPFRIATEEQVASYNERGFFVLEDAFDPETLKAVITEIDPWEERVESFLRTREDGKLFIARSNEITFTTHLVTRSDILRDFCRGPVFRDLCFDLLGADVRLYWDQAVYKKPGANVPFPWHQDNGYTYVDPQQYLTCWVALTDATEENGCPWVLPGAHRVGTFEHRITDLGFECVRSTDRAAECAIPAPARAGSIVVFSSLTPHATGPNRTDSVRKAYIVQFAPDGAEVLQDGTRTRCDAPERQFPILIGGEAPE